MPRQRFASDQPMIGGNMKTKAGRSRVAFAAACSVAVVVGLLGATAPVGVDAQSQEPKPTIVPTVPTAGGLASTGIDGNSYRGPTYGVTLRWDETVWTVEDESLSPGYEGLQIGTPRSTVWVESYARFDGNAAECLADAALEIRNRTGVSKLRAATGRDRPVPTEVAGPALMYVYTQALSEGGTTEMVEYVECRTLVEGEAVLEITFLVAAPHFMGELPLARALLATLEVP